MFEGFTRTEIETPSSDVRRRAHSSAPWGRRPALLLLHGNPMTHVMWHRIAPRLAAISRSWPPICAATATARSLGRSRARINYSFRAMARDQVEVMRQLGYRGSFWPGMTAAPARPPGCALTTRTASRKPR